MSQIFRSVQAWIHQSRFPLLIWVAGQSVVVSSLLLTGLLVGVQQWGGLEPLELAVFDQYKRLQPDADPDPRILWVKITEADLHRYRWPLSDQILADSLARLQAHDPRVIGLDLYRDLPNPPGEAELAAQLQADNLIAIAEIVGEIPAPPEVAPERVGFNDLALDVDGVMRRNLLFVPTADQDYYSFALRVILAYLGGAESAQFRYSPDALFFSGVTLTPLSPTSGGYQTADTSGYQILLDYRGRDRITRTVTLSQLLAGEVEPDWIRGNIVLVGTDAPSLKDLFYTPYSVDENAFQMSGVMIHAQMISQLLDIATGKQRLFQFWPWWGELLWLWGWTVVGSCLVWRSTHPLALASLTILGVGVIGGLGWGLFAWGMIWIPVMEPAVGFVGALGVTMAYRLLYITRYDPLTGLLNRSSFGQFLRRSLTRMARLQGESTLGVMVLSLDRLRIINESLGPGVGDRLLWQVTHRLKALLPRSARLAKVGNEQFAIALDYTAQATLTTLAETLHKALSQPFHLEQQSVVIQPHLGIAMTQSMYQYTADNLLRDAQTAMYRAQASGTNHYEVFAAGMLTDVVDRFTLENDLHRGIAAHEFVLYYQPIIHLETEQIAGFEALVRWQHPEKGLVAPLIFIPLAEETGLILPLGDWICETACHQLRTWQQQFPDSSLMMSINLSGRQFEQSNLSTFLAQTIQAAGINGATLKLEITESLIMGDVEGAIDVMLQLKALGCKLGLDDFGTGYSSLSQLRRFPIDMLKVDQSFVQNMGASQEDYAIVQMIATLGQTLGMDLIAEGVETPADAAALRSLNCEYGQGYFWSQPLSAVQATELLHQQSLHLKQQDERPKLSD